MDTNNSSGLIALLGETKNMAEISKDYILSSNRLKASYDTEGVYLDVEELGRFNITENCHNQISEKTEIPLKYYNRVKQADNKLLADNINAWLPCRDKRMIRTLNYPGRKDIRALLSDRYKPLDNYDLLLTCLRSFNDYKQKSNKPITIKQHYLSETSFYLKVSLPEVKLEVEPGKNDWIFAGLLISNSEVGKRALTISPLTHRLSCMNDAICIESYRKHHLGQSIGIDNIFTDITRRSQNETIWLEVKDVINSALEGKFLEEKVNQYRELKGITFDMPNDKVKEITKTYKFSDFEAELILENFLSDLDKSAYGIMNAITGLGHTLEGDRRIEVERLGDKIALNLLGVEEKDITISGEGE